MEELLEASPAAVPAAIQPAELAAGLEARAEAEAAPVPASGFVISVTSGGRCRRLHQVEVCPLKPGVHYGKFEPWGDLLPPVHEYNVVCKRCLPTGPAWALSALATGEEVEPSDASSSSSGSSQAAAAKQARPEEGAPEISAL